MEGSLSSAARAIFVFFCMTCALWTERASCFNYDYASSCTRPYRSARSGAKVAPCDLSKQTYCNLPGSTYPWHAVRRFVHENQGLMRRMYGDQRHISVLKAEIENNDIDSDDMFQVPVRDSSFGRYSKDWDVLNTKFVYAKRPGGRSNEPHTVPHFRPVQTTPTSTTTTTTTKTTAKVEDSTKKSIEDDIFFPKRNKEAEDLKIAAYKTSFFEDELDAKDISKTNLEMNKIEPEIVTLEAAIKQTLEMNGVYPNYGTGGKNATIRPNILNLTIETSSAADSTTSEYMTPTETTNTPDVSDMPTEEDDGWKPVMMDKTSPSPSTVLFSQSVKDDQSNKNDRIDLNTDESYKNQDQVAMGSNTAATTHLEGQLYQDVVQEDLKPIVKLRGVNACPVKEEVVAPFWANNTRGEVLALLNLYPFEQYVHWEKCTHEHKQMFCREGCRCEQQYRLHRLLAYDPNNECRGIFSDWFKFPSCCVCKCYDMPLEFRVTSRSPRTIEPELDEAVKKEMYQQAASDWYTINLDD